MGNNIQTIQQTNKAAKIVMAVGSAIIAAGIYGMLTIEQDEMRTIAGIGGLVIGSTVFIAGRLMKWWKND